MPSPHDRSRLEACFEKHHPEIERHLRRRCPSPEDAEDAATEVFTIAWRRVRRMPEEPESRLWLYSIARLVVANQQRSARRSRRLHEKLAREPLPELADPRADPIDDLVTELHASSERFATLWADPPASASSASRKTFSHPTVGTACLAMLPAGGIGPVG